MSKIHEHDLDTAEKIGHMQSTLIVHDKTIKDHGEWLRTQQNEINDNRSLVKELLSAHKRSIESHDKLSADLVLSHKQTSKDIADMQEQIKKLMESSFKLKKILKWLGEFLNTLKGIVISLAALTAGIVQGLPEFLEMFK